jgi:protein disulfide-isomerase
MVETSGAGAQSIKMPARDGRTRWNTRLIPRKLDEGRTGLEESAMKVEVWSDIVCPFCYIGKRRFEAALARFEHKAHVEVQYRSFELDPHAPQQTAQTIHEMLAAKYGITAEQAKALNANVAEQAKSVGLTFVFDTMTPANTFDAHRLIHHAAAEGKRDDMIERLFAAYFTESKKVSDRSVLVELAAEIGLDKRTAAEVLERDTYTAEVRKDEEEAGRIGIRGVPFFLFNRKYGVSGAHPSEVFLQALEKVWEEENPTNPVRLDAQDGAACTDAACTPGAAPAEAPGKARN